MANSAKRNSGTADSSSALADLLGDQKYKYQPLEDTDEIRLIILEPGVTHNELVCTLAPVNLGDDVYKAISYRWGTPVGDHIVIRDELLLHVTENLHAALRRTRHEET
jgi:hypothetical protein